MRRRHRRSHESERLLREVEGWAARTKTTPSVVYVQAMKRKWASCSTDGRIYLSSDLGSEPIRFRDVVIVHELLHLRIQNHGKLFKSLMNSFVPGWESAIEGRARRVCR